MAPRLPRLLRWPWPLQGHLIWLSALLIAVATGLTSTLGAWPESTNASARAGWLGALLLSSLAGLLWLTHRLSRSLRHLAEQARATRDFQFRWRTAALLRARSR